MVPRKVPETLQCPACRGLGGETESILDTGEGPWYECGWCVGRGTLPRNKFYKVLGHISAERRRTEKYYRMTHEFYRD